MPPHLLEPPLSRLPTLEMQRNRAQWPPRDLHVANFFPVRPWENNVDYDFAVPSSNALFYARKIVAGDQGVACTHPLWGV